MERSQSTGEEIKAVRNERGGVRPMCKDAAIADKLACLSATGSAIFRNVFTTQICDALIADAKKIYAVLIGDKEPKRGGNTAHFDSVAAQPLRGFRDFGVNVIAKFTETAPYAAFEELFGPRVAFPLQQCIFRYQRPDHQQSFLSYHQDATHSKVECRVINCWISLTAAGLDAPGVEVLDVPVHDLHPDLYSFGNDYFEKQRLAPDKVKAQLALDSKVKARFGNPTSTIPIFAPGDAIMFDHFAMHRTHFTPEMTQNRMSLEIRACDPVLFDKWYGNFDRVVVERSGTKRRLSLMVHEREWPIDNIATYHQLPQPISFPLHSFRLRRAMSRIKRRVAASIVGEQHSAGQPKGQLS